MRTTPRRIHRTHFATAFALLALCLLAPAAARAQWTQPDSNNNINNTNTGNVGVGTSAPASRLEVQGTSSRGTAAVIGDGDSVGYAGLKIQARTTTNIATDRTSMFFLSMRKDGWYSGDTSGPSFIIETASKTGNFAAPFMIKPNNDVILNGGRGAVGLGVGWVGVGTTAPSALLHVNSSYTQGNVRVSGSGGALMNFYDSAAPFDRKLYQWRSEGGLFRMALVNDAENAFVQQNILVADSSGNVGVGTTSPGEPDAFVGSGARVLHVDGSTVDRGAELILSGSGTVSSGHVLSAMLFAAPGLNAGYRNAAAIISFLSGSTANRLGGDLRFRTRDDNSTSMLDRMTISRSGNVGVGTISPLYSLDVNGGVNGFRARAATTSAGDAVAVFENGSGLQAIIRGNGNVGIGTASPAHRLDVAGSVNGTGLCIAGDCKTSWSQVGGSSGSTTQLAVDAPSGYGARLVVGQPSADYPGNAGWAASWNSNLLLNGADSTSISFHDANARVDTLRVAAGTFNIGENVGWGVANARVHGSLFTDGSLGVGTTTPNGKFEVAGGSMFLGDMGNAGWGNVVVRGRVFSASNNIHLSPPGGSAVVINSDYRDAGGLGGPVNLHVSGDVVVGGNITAKFQDVAEWVPSVQRLRAGTVVVLDAGRTNHVLASGREYDTSVAGVVSARPGLVLGEGGEGKVMVATTGRVRVRVDATRSPVRVGDLLVTSGAEGVAMKSVPVELGGVAIHRPGTIIGKALEPLAGGVGEILVLLSLQ